MFTTFTDVFRSVIDKMEPLKTKIIRGKALSKAIMTRLGLRSKYNKWQSRENFFQNLLFPPPF